MVLRINNQLYLQIGRTVELVKAKGGTVIKNPALLAKGDDNSIAFIEDPDGYKFKLLEKKLTSDPLCQVMLHVGDLDRAINFYKKVHSSKISIDRSSLITLVSVMRC